MNKTLQNIIASCYVGLIIFGLISVTMNTLHGIILKIFLGLLCSAIVGLLFVLHREEEDEINQKGI